MGGGPRVEATAWEWFRVMRHRVILSGLACLAAGSSAFYASGGSDSPNRSQRAPALGFVEAGSFKRDGLPASLCIAGADAPALRTWISEHPKSRRGRLDHQRLRLQAAD